MEMQPNMMKYQLNKNEMETILNISNTGVITTIGEDGYPYGAPVNFIYLDGKIYFHGRKIGEKIDNFLKNSKVGFSVFCEEGFEDNGVLACNTTTVYESVIIRGDASVVESESEKNNVIKALSKKLSPEKEIIDPKKVALTGVFRIDIVSMTGKYHKPKVGCPVRH